MPTEFSLGEVYPNPMHSAGTIRFDLPASKEVHILLFDMLGRRIMTVLDHPMTSGIHEVVLRLRGVPSGSYLLHVGAGDWSAGRMVYVVK